MTIFQEQIMLLSQELADFTCWESNLLYAALQKRMADKLIFMKEKFLLGCKANGHHNKIVKKNWSEWEKLGAFAFCKSHAVCYTLLAYQAAYLKANFKEEYMNAVKCYPNL